MPKQLVVGVDVSRHSSQIAIFEPSHNQYGDTFKVSHTRADFDNLLLRTIDLEAQFKTEAIFVIESASHYYRAISEFLHRNGYRVYLVNPLRIKTFSNFNMRNVMNDRVDAVVIARFYLAGCVKEEDRFKPSISNLRAIVRHYSDLVKLQTRQRVKLLAILDLVFPGFHRVFKPSVSPGALEFLQLCPTPESVLKADPSKLRAELLKKAPRLKPEGVDAKVRRLKELAKEALFRSGELNGGLIRMQTLIRILLALNLQVNHYLKILKQTVKAHPGYEYLSTIPGIGVITGAMILAEIGDISLFKDARKLTGFTGISPPRSKSSHFTGTHNRMSKRGSPYLRTAFYLAARAAIYSNWTRNPQAQAMLREFYEKKRAEGKKPKVALGAVMRKLVHYTYAVLRDKQPFTIAGC